MFFTEREVIPNNARAFVVFVATEHDHQSIKLCSNIRAGMFTTCADRHPCDSQWMNHIWLVRDNPGMQRGTIITKRFDSLRTHCTRITSQTRISSSCIPETGQGTRQNLARFLACATSAAMFAATEHLYDDRSAKSGAQIRRMDMSSRLNLVRHLFVCRTAFQEFCCHQLKVWFPHSDHRTRFFLDTAIHI